jgi:UDP-N-acetylmuramyl-tripeptide synthetase
MEVSSHALELERVTGVGFDAAVFTNLGRDHLDFHPDLDSYAAAKQRLFEGLGKVARARKPVAVVNADDPRSRQMAEAAARGDKAEVVTFGLGPDSAWLARAIALQRTPAGPRTHFVVSGPAFEGEASMRLLGNFNVANLLGALAAAVAVGLPASISLRAMAECPGAPGRFEVVSGGPGSPTVVVDYAHKPDSLTAVLRTARKVTSGRIIAVFGCGGDRDRGKRPMMGAVVAELADSSWVTSDNPRSESPGAIIEEILGGLRPTAERTGHAYRVEPDRAAAIAGAIAQAGPDDLVLIAGKGHETYQIFADRTIHFDDREHARDALGSRQAGAPPA